MARFAASSSTVLLLLLPILPSPLLPANPLSLRIHVASLSFEGEEEVLGKEVVWLYMVCLPFDGLMIGTVAAKRILPTMLLLCPLRCLAVLQLSPNRRLPFGLPPNTVLFFRQRKAQEVCMERISDA